MRRSTAAIALLPVLAGCGGAVREVTTPPPPGPVTAESLVAEGRRQRAAQEFDSAAQSFSRALSLDSTFRPARRQLADLRDDLARRGTKDRRVLRAAREALADLERRGEADGEDYERLCELCVLLGDTAEFLGYAQKNAAAFPFDRQYFNLGVASLQARDYAGAVKAMKEAKEKFPASEFLGGFYRQLGDAYAGMDRDQTAERTYTAGVTAVEGRLAAMRREGRLPANDPVARRLSDDRRAMLLALRKLHQLYQAPDKLKDVERRLREAGYD